MSQPSLDETDRRILHHLQENARRTITDIAESLGVADNTVRNRIAALRDEGVIDGYTVDIAYDAAGVQHNYLFVCTAQVKNRESLADDVRDFPEVVSVKTLMTGKRNVLVTGVGRETSEISDLAHRISEAGLDVVDEELIRTETRHAYAGFRD